MSREVIRTIVKEINCGSQYHSVIADRTQHYIDIVCRRSVHLHHIDPAMQTNENLVIISYTPNNSMDFIGKIAYWHCVLVCNAQYAWMNQEHSRENVHKCTSFQAKMYFEVEIGFVDHLVCFSSVKEEFQKNLLSSHMRHSEEIKMGGIKTKGSSVSMGGWNSKCACFNVPHS